jgi:hypothetical protein
VARLVLLLPARARLHGALPEAVARALGRADALPPGEEGGQAQLLRHFELLPRGWPVAALTRQLDAGDAALAAWVRADPAHVRPDINGARLLACGSGLGMDADDCRALMPALRPLFGDAGFPIDAPHPERWYLRLPREARLPRFATPEKALGADLFEQLPESDDAPEGRRWRALLGEAQVVLHNHPWNARRAEAGKAPVNSLWFWGGGILPDHVSGKGLAQVSSEDVLLRALATTAGCSVAPSAGFCLPGADALVDLRGERDAGALGREWLAPAQSAIAAGDLGELHLDFADGTGLRVERRQRWRLWRRPLPWLAEVPPG